MCSQASSTPSERVFSTAGDTISQERSRILPEKADMLIFLQKNLLFLQKLLNNELSIMHFFLTVFFN